MRGSVHWLKGYPRRAGCRRWRRRSYTSCMRRQVWKIVICLAIGAVLSAGVGVLASWGRSAGWPGWLSFFGPGSRGGESGQPPVSFKQSEGHVRFNWEVRPWYDLVRLQWVSNIEWIDSIENMWPDVERVPELLERLRNDPRYVLWLPFMERHQWASFAASMRAICKAPPDWAAPVAALDERVSTETVAYGWPMRVVRCTTKTTRSGTRSPTTAFSESDGIGESGLIAWKPIWPRLLLSSVIYGVPLWIMWTLLAAARARRHRRRDRCVGCGYDLSGAVAVEGRGVVCPECGRGEVTGS